MATASYVRCQKNRERGKVGSNRLANTTRIGLTVKNLRLFNCSCHHPLRFGTKNCSYCFRPTPFYNRIPFWAALLLVIAVLSMQLFGFGFDETLSAAESDPPATQNMAGDL
tara:strand:- start:510 stop:842 length:333 start_codon:yes stop_codon:yes gene_type:complete